MFARRTVLKGAVVLPLAAILADPILGQAAAAATGRAFDSADTELAWARTAAFLKKHLS